MNSRLIKLALGAILAGASAALAADRIQATSPDGSWFTIDSLPAAIEAGDAWVRPAKFQAIKANWAALRSVLGALPHEDVTPVQQSTAVVWLPMPDGSFARFAVVESPILHPQLGAQYPEIRTYLGQGLDDPAATVRFDSTLHGFHAQILGSAGAVYIDPVTTGDLDYYASYYKRDYAKNRPHFNCGTHENDVEIEPLATRGGGAARTGATRRTYRIAVAATAEYSAGNGNSVGTVLSAITTSINRITGIYETDLAVRLQIVPSNSAIIFLNNPMVPDPYNSPENGSATNTTNQFVLDTTIGSANYDIGHVFHRTSLGANGIAGAIGNVCRTGEKAKGYSAGTTTTGDPFNVDLVAHEMGHQFGARHNFNNCFGGPGDNPIYAVEPGSGTTIMSYAGICSGNNVQSNSDPMLAWINIDQMNAYIDLGGACFVGSTTGNSAPVVADGGTHVIPAGTPFALTANATDPDNDQLTYSWEQSNRGGPPNPLPIIDNGVSPIFRSFRPASSPVRVFPRLSAIQAGQSSSVGEILPTTARTLTFRCVVRDNRAGSGGVEHTDATVTVINSAGPFSVTAPNTAGSFSGALNVTWNVAGTNVPPVNTAFVKISLSTDGGVTFPTVLAESTPNDGAHSVVLPNVSTTQARIKVEATNSIYFDMSNANFTIAASPIASFVSNNINTVSDNTGNGNRNGAIDPGESAINLTLGVRNIGTGTATSVVGNLSSLTPTVSVVTGQASYPDLGSTAEAGNLTPYVISVAADHPCGQPITLRLQVTNAQVGPSAFDVTLDTGQGTAPTLIAYNGAPVAIPDNGTAVDIPLVVSGTGTITDLNFAFDGANCSAADDAPTVGLQHTWVGDLVVTLISPQGTQVTLMNRPGPAPFGSDGNHFCNTLLDDEGGHPLIQSIRFDDQPHSGSYTPHSPLSAFDGEGVGGTWILRIRDVAAQDSGTLRAFSLRITTPRTCQPPSTNQPCPGDLTGDRVVNESDLGVLLQSWQSGPGGDLNGDGLTNESDLGLLLQNWTNVCP